MTSEVEDTPTPTSELLKTFSRSWNDTLQAVAMTRVGRVDISGLTPQQLAYRLEETTTQAIEMRSETINFLILAGPTGGGKDTIGSLLEQGGIIRFPRTTDRTPRLGERDGVHSIFVTPEQFTKMEEQGAFLQCSRTYGEGRGTEKNRFFDYIARGQKFFIEGSSRTPRDFKGNPETAGVNFLTVTLLPPSFEELVVRLRTRGMSESEMFKRFPTAITQLQQSADTTDLFVVNDTVRRAATTILDVLQVKRAP